jgi:hypothetical protein
MKRRSTCRTRKIPVERLIANLLPCSCILINESLILNIYIYSINKYKIKSRRYKIIFYCVLPLIAINSTRTVYYSPILNFTVEL